MAEGKFIGYFRVSTAQQGRSGLGLEAQQKAVLDFLNGGSWVLVESFTEVESGKRDDRPQLQAAIEACRLYGAKLVIAKLDRLSRDVAFLANLQKSGIEFVCADMPTANKLTIHILAAVAEEERRMISARTKAALEAAKARGTKLGGFRGHVATEDARAKATASLTSGADEYASRVRPAIERIRQDNPGASLRTIAAELEGRGIATRRGGKWTAAQVSRIMGR